MFAIQNNSYGYGDTPRSLFEASVSLCKRILVLDGKLHWTDKTALKTILVHSAGASVSLSSTPFEKGGPDGFPKLYSGALPQTPHLPCGRGQSASVPCQGVFSVSLCQEAFTAYPRRTFRLRYSMFLLTSFPLFLLTLIHIYSLPTFR